MPWEARRADRWIRTDHLLPFEGGYWFLEIFVGFTVSFLISLLGMGFGFWVLG
jgi:hypothetical protein